MAQGRKPLPTAIKKKKGTLQKCREVENELSPKLVQSIPSPPEDMREVAKTEWFRIVGELSRLGVLSHLDLTLIEVYCNEYSVYIEMEQLLQKNGRVIFYKNADGSLKHAQRAPHQSIADRSVDKMIKIAQEFGFTPSARTRISAIQMGIQDKNDSEIENEIFG